MSEEHGRTGRTSPQASDGRSLGASFAAHQSQSYGEDVGEAFAAQNAESAQQAVKAVRGRRSRWWVVGSIVLALVLVLLLVHVFTGNKPSRQGAGNAAGAGAGGAGAAGGGGGRGQNGPAAITTGQTQTGDMPVYVEALGTVTPLNTISVYSQVTGRVLAVKYREGQMVQKGQVLIEIDPRPYEATLAQAQGTLLHDQGVLAQARIDLGRYQAAYARNAIAKQTLDDQEQAVLQDQGTIATDQATIDYDQVQLSYCHVLAPITGRVGLRLVDVGNTVFSGTGSTLVVITQINPITVVFNVSEDDLPQVQAQLKGRNASLQVEAYDRSDVKKIGTGKLTSLDNEVDTTTGTVKFRATFDNRANTFYPNQFVNTHLLVRTLRGATLVPTAAVEHNGTQAFLYVVKQGARGDVVVVQNVTAATNNDTVTAVTGINPGVTVATSGFDRLENNVPVRIANGHGAAPGATGGAHTGGPGSTGQPNSAANQPASGSADNQSSPGTGASNGPSAQGTSTSSSGSKAP